MDENSRTFIEQAINFLQLATDKHGRISKDKMRIIKNVIEKLEDVLYERE